MHDYVKTLGTVIRKAREEQGMSQASLAEKLSLIHISEPTRPY